MTLIQASQINLNSLSGFVANVASGTGIGALYYPASNPSGFITPNQTGQFQPSGQYYSSNNPSGFITAGNSVGSYFGHTGFSISSAGNFTGRLLSGQGIITTRIDVLSGNYTGNFIISSGNAFPGAITRYKFRMLGGTGASITISGYNSNLLLTQPGLSVNTNVFFEFEYDGTKWNNDLWV